MKTRTLGLIVGLAFALLLQAQFARAQSRSRIMDLIHQSDYIGFVHGDPNMNSSREGGTQWIFIHAFDPFTFDPLKGVVKHDYGNGSQYPWMHTVPQTPGGYPTWFGERGEYLVFCRFEPGELMPKLLAIAAFPVIYKPNADGVVTGTLFNDEANLRPLTLESTRSLLQETINGGIESFEDATVLDAYLAGSILPQNSSPTNAMPSFEARFAQAKQLIALIQPGTPRSQIEKMFPQSDGGCVGSNQGRYYFGSEVMINVPYDGTGGIFSPQNRVNGPLEVYRSMMHFD